MEHKQTNRKKIKIIAVVFTVMLAAALLYWLYVSLLGGKQNNQAKQGIDRQNVAFQEDDTSISPQQPNTRSQSSSDDNKTDQPQSSSDTGSSHDNSTEAAGSSSSLAVYRSSAPYHYRQAKSSGKKPPSSSSIFQKPGKPGIRPKPGGNKPVTPPNPPNPPKPTPEPVPAAVKIVGAAEVGSTLI